MATNKHKVANPERARAMVELRRSNAATRHPVHKVRKNTSRADKLRRALEQEH